MLTKSVIRGASWLLGGRIVANFLGFISTVLVARLLVPEDFGLVALGSSVLAVVSSLVELPTGAALIQLKDVDDDDYGTAWTLGILKGLVICLVMVLVAWPVAAIFEEPRLFDLILLLSVFPLIMGLRNAHFEAFAREMKFGREMLLDVTSKIGTFIVTVGVAYMFRSFWALPLGMIAYGVVAIAVSFWLAPKIPRLTLKSFKRIFNFSAWLGASAMVNQLNWQSDSFIIGRILGPAVLGQTAVGTILVQRIDEVTRAPLFRSLFSAFSQIRTDEDRLRRAYLSSQAFCVAILAPVGLGLGAVANPATLLVLGDRWQDAALVVAFIAPISAMMALIAPSQALALAVGRTRSLFERDVAGLLVRLPCLLVGILTAGLLGVLVALAISSVLMLIINLSMIRRLIGIPIVQQISNCRRSVAAGFIMYGVCATLAGFVPLDGPILLRVMSLGGVVALGGGVYMACVLALWKLEGSPEGPESRLLGFASSIRQRVSGALRHRRGAS